MYYERYYIDHLPVSQTNQQPETTNILDFNQSKPMPIGSLSSSLTRKDAMQELREKIRDKVSQSTEKLKKNS